MSTAAAPASPSFAPDDFAWLTRVVHERSAIRIEESKAYLVATRLASIATEGGHADVAALIARPRSRLYLICNTLARLTQPHHRFRRPGRSSDGHTRRNSQILSER